MPNHCKQRRQFILGGAALLGTSVLASPAVRAAVPEKFIAVMDFLPSWKQAAFHLAKVKGWYNDAGLDVQIDDGSGSSVTIAQVNAEKCDIGLASLSAMAVSKSKGTDVIAVGAVLRTNDIGMIIDKKLGISKPSELADKNATIFFESTSFQSLFPPFFKNLGIDVTKVKLVPLSPASAIGTYLAGQGDAIITTVPYVSPLVEQKRPSDAYMLSSYGLPLPAHGLVVNKALLGRRADALRKFLAVSDRAWHQVWNGDPKEAIAALVDQRPLARIDADLEIKRIAAYKPFAGSEASRGKNDLWMPPSDWQTAIKIMGDTSIIASDSRASDFFTNDYLPT